HWFFLDTVAVVVAFVASVVAAFP
ncbi:hypothetical protein A2U01_0114975, partial [Trifolium medium]|nr:hypothetical protein [Trifolium medium]